MAQTVYDELIGTIREYDASYNTDPDKGESPQQHLIRLTRYVARDLPVQGWDALSVGAQDWHDSAADALRGEKTVPEPAGYPDKPAAETRRRRSVVDDPPAAETQCRR